MNAGALAALLPEAKTLGDRVLLEDAVLPDNVLIDGARIDHLDLRDVRPRGDLTFSNCTIDTLDIQGLQFRGDGVLSLINCAVQRLQIRSIRNRKGVSLENVRAASLVVHDLGPLRAHQVVAETEFTGSRLRRHCGLEGIFAGYLAIRGLEDRELTVHMRNVSCRESMSIDGGELAELVIEEVRAGTLAIRRLSTHSPARSVEICRATVSGDAHFESLSSRAAPGLQLRISRIGGSLGVGAIDLDRLEPSSFTLAMEDTFVGGDLRLEDVRTDRSLPVSLRRSTIGGTLQLSKLATGLDAAENDGVCVSLEDASLNNVLLPARQIRRRVDARALARSLFGASDATSLEALRLALLRQHRASDEDVVYGELQDERHADGPGSRLTRAVLGGIFGWGVRIAAPIRALAIGMVATAAVLLALAPHGGSELDRCANAVARAIGLWANVDTGLAGNPDTAAFAFLQVLSAVAGLLFATMVVGLIIRKLVR